MALQPDMVVTTTVENLTLRGSAGTSGERLGLLALGTTAFVVDGPAVVDGVPWYLIAGMGLPYASGCATLPPDAPISCPAFVGWAAGTNQAGAPWIEGRQPGPCPQPTIESISERGATWRLVCWADQEITFDAWWPGPSQVEGDCPPLEDPGGFLLCEYVNPNWLSASSDEGFIQRLSLSIDPASGVEMPDGGQPVRVTGRFDHPAADLCASLNADAGPQLLVLQCRLRFVPSSVEPLRS